MLKHNRRGFLALLAATPVLSLFPGRSWALDENQARDFVMGVTERLIRLIQAPDPIETKRGAFKELMLDSSDMTTIARFAIGRRWKDMSEAQQADYRSAFTDYLSRIYTSRFSDYEGQTIEFASTRSGKKDLYVITNLVRERAEPIEVSWRVREFGGAPKILDIEAEGVSLLVSLKNEVSGLLAQNGDSVDKVIEVLKSKA